MSQTAPPARGVVPGRIIQRELEARGWTQKDLAEITGRPVQAINEIIRGTKRITPETALELAKAFGTSPELWMNLETNYRLHLARQEGSGDDIERKSRLYSTAPVAELLKRGWIQAHKSLSELEKEVCAFLRISSIDETAELRAAFRQAHYREPELNSLISWVRRGEQLASGQIVAPFEAESLRQAIPELLGYSEHVEDLTRLPLRLARLGVHFVIVPHLSKTYVDGAALFLDDHPVIAVSLRYDRIDSFWFTLLHELAHIVQGHQGLHVDNWDVPSAESDEEEANQLASEWLIEPGPLTEFVRNTKPYFYRTKVEFFARSQGRHPGIVVGRLQSDKHLPYSHLRALMVKVSPHLRTWIDTVPPSVESTTS